MNKPTTMGQWQDFVFSVLGCAPGQRATDWVRVLTDAPFPVGYGPGFVPTAPMPYWGVTKQVGAGGVRGVIFLPTQTPDANNYYTRQILLLDNQGGDCSRDHSACIWAWRDLGHLSGAGVPVAIEGVNPPSHNDAPHNDGPSGNILEELARRIIALEEQMKTKIGDGDKLSLQMDAGQWLCAQNGGPEEPNKVVEFQSREEPSNPGWEVFGVKKQS